MQNNLVSLIPTVALDALVEAGAVVQAGSATGDAGVDVLVRLAGNDPASSELVAFRVKRLRGAMTVSTVEDLARPRRHARSLANGAAVGVLVVCDRASARARAAAIEAGVSVVALRGVNGGGPDGHLVVGGGVLLPLGQQPDVDTAGPSSPGPAQWSRLLVMRVLAVLGPRPQAELAGLAGVSQPRVSQICADLIGEGLLAPRTLRVLDWDGLADRWLHDYPGPGGVTTYWYGLGALSEQAGAVIEHLARASGDSQPGPRVSGELAADLISPWGRPGTATVYAKGGADLSAVGLTPSPAAEATLRLTVPQDPGVWAVPPQWRRSGDRALPVADPLQVLYDLRHASGDAAQTADRLRGHLHDVVTGWQVSPDTAFTDPSTARSQ